MSIVFDPFTGQIIDTGASAGMAIGGPVAGASPNAILLTDASITLTDIQLADGEILIGKTGDAPLAATLTGTANQVDVTNGPNTITLSTPQDIDVLATPEFAGLTLTGFSGPVKAAAGVLSSSDIDLTSEVTGILPVGNGGTGLDGSSAPNGHILIGNGTGYSLTDISGTTNQVIVSNGSGTIQISTPQDIDSGASPEFYSLSLNGSLDTSLVGGSLGIGANNASIINIGNPTATVNIQGDTIYQNVTNLNVQDKNITVNVGGSIGSSAGAGIHVEEGGVSNAGHVEVTGDREGWEFHPPGIAGIAYLRPGLTGITIDQSSHDPVTIASPANGLGINNQEVSIELATASSTGALSFTDWSTFNNKQDALTFGSVSTTTSGVTVSNGTNSTVGPNVGIDIATATAINDGLLSSVDWNTFNNKQNEYIFKVTAYDPINTTLPIADPVVIDGYTIVTGDKVLFSNLSSGNNEIYEATVSAGLVLWNSIATPAVNDYVLVQNGDAFALQAGVFTGTSYDFNRVIRHFNGVDYWEQSAIYTVSLLNNTPNNIFTINIANSENMIVDYSVIRGVKKTTGTLFITSDGVDAKVSDIGVDLTTSLGTTFIAYIISGQIVFDCITDNSGDNGELKYNLRRWSDAPGGPGGLPSYTSGGGSSTITVEQVGLVNPNETYNNISTIQFDNDTGFDVTPVSAGVVKVSLGSTFKTWDINNGAGPAQPSLVAVGEDTVEFVAGTNIEFVTDNTLGSKSFTINSTGGGGSTVQTVTLSNGATNQNVTGFIVDPTTYDGFNADIVITRDVPSGIELKSASPLNVSFNQILQLTDGSAILYNNDSIASVYTIKKVDATGATDATFSTGTGFNGYISTIIDVTEDSTNSVLAVFGGFTDYNGNTRNRVCFIDGNTGADLFDLYDGFGIASGGTGFSSGTINSVTKIKYTSNIASSTSPYGYMIIGTMDYFNDMTMTTPLTSKAIIVSCQRGQGYVQIPNGSSFATTAYLLTPVNKYTSNISFSVSPSITVSNVPWSDAQEYYYRFSNNGLYVNDFSGSINMGMGYFIATFGTFMMGTAYVYSMDTNTDGSVLFVGGDFTQITSPSIVSLKSMAKFNVPSISSIVLDSSFNPLSAETSPSVYVYKIIANDSLVNISGGYINNTSTCQNYCILNYDGTVNTSALIPFGTGFAIDAVLSFSSNFFLQIKPFPDLGNLYGFNAIIPASYVTKMYGCNEYSGVTPPFTPNMTIQGYSYTGGIYPEVSLSFDSAGQLKYTSSNITGGSNFTMKYILNKL